MAIQEPKSKAFPCDSWIASPSARNDRVKVVAPSGSAPVKRSVAIRGHRTSISLETDFWDALQEIAAARECSVSGLIAEIDAMRPAPQNTAGLSTTLRLYVLAWYRERAAR